MSGDRFSAFWLSHTSPASGTAPQAPPNPSASPPLAQRSAGAVSGHVTGHARSAFTFHAENNPTAAGSSSSPYAPPSSRHVDVTAQLQPSSSSSLMANASAENAAGRLALAGAAPYPPLQQGQQLPPPPPPPPQSQTVQQGSYYRPPKQQQQQHHPQQYSQQQQQQQHYVQQPQRGFYAGSSATSSPPTASMGGYRHVSDATPAYTVAVPGGGGGGAVGHSSDPQWRGGSGSGSGSGGYPNHRSNPDFTRRRSDGGRSTNSTIASNNVGGGHADTIPVPRRQQQQQQQVPSYRSQVGRNRPGGVPSADPYAHTTPAAVPFTGPEGPAHRMAHRDSAFAHGATEPSASPPQHATTAAAAASSAPAPMPLPLPHGPSSSASGQPPGRRSSAASGGSGGRRSGADPPFFSTRPPSHPPPPQLPPSMQGGGGPLSVDAGSGGGASPGSQPPPPSATNSGGVSRSGVSTASTTTTTTTTNAARYARPRGEDRPTVALSQNIMSVYQTINEIFYQERQKLLAAPAKYAARKYEDTSGHYIPCEGEIIADRYVFKELVGQGSFGKVLHCIDRKYNEPVAVKIIRSGPYFESQGWFEAQVVAHLNNDASLQNLVVQLRKVFSWKGHMVLVFEPLSFSLYKLITLTRHNGVSLDLTRKFAYQMVKVLLVLEQHQPPIIHCDLKPENVLLRDPSRSGVRVIDFGSACYQQQATWRLPPALVPLPPSSPSASPGPPWDGSGGRSGASPVRPSAPSSTSASSPSSALPAGSAAPAAGDVVASRDGAEGVSGTSASTAATATKTAAESVSDAPGSAAAAAAGAATAASAADVEVVMPKYIQSRYYRSPEVILELGYTTAIDRWSLGCFLTEMHTGRPLFQGNNEADMIAYFTMVRGPLPDYMIAASPKRTRLYYTCAAEGTGGVSSSNTAGGMAAQTLLQQQQQQQQQQQRAASPLLAFTTSPSPTLTPFTEAPGHAPGSPFFLRAAQVEDTESATAYAVRAEGRGTPLEKVLGVYTGGPRGCRAGQPGHDEATYETFYDFIDKLLQYDPRKRMSCSQAIQHPFLEPIRLLEARAASAAAAAATATPTASSHTPSAAATSSPAPSQPPPQQQNGDDVGDRAVGGAGNGGVGRPPEGTSAEAAARPASEHPNPMSSV